MRTFLRIAPVLVLAVGASGCKEYFTVDEACHPDGKFRGMDIDLVDAGEARAIDRMNCYRRLVGFSRYGVQKELQQAGENMASYVVQNPDIYGRTGGNSLTYLIQEGARPGFTGTEIWERLDTADYNLPDVASLRVEQVIGILPYEVSGAEVVDEIMMRQHWTQESVITPSPYEIAYVESTLDAAWWQSTGLDPALYGPLPEKGTFLYLAVSSQTPPTEGAGEEPIVYPKRNMEGVPLSGPLALDRYVPDVNVDGVVDLLDTTQLSYPITLGYTSALNPTGNTGTTPFNLVITSATIDGPNGPLDTVWTSPGESDPANNRFDAVVGDFSFWAGGIYATEPFQPNTAYRLYVDITTVDGPVSHDLSFTTAGSDSIGGGGGGNTGTTSRSLPGASRSNRPLQARWLGGRSDVR